MDTHSLSTIFKKAQLDNQFSIYEPDSKTWTHTQCFQTTYPNVMSDHFIY